MAIYHLTVKIVDRKSGRSVIGAAAYRAGERIKELSTGTTWDFTHKPGVEHREILAPDNAPDWAHDRSQLWNTVDRVEKRKDAQLARDLEIALPIELDPTAQVALLRDYLHHHFVSQGMIADSTIHRDNPNNPHAHVLLTMRNITQNGFGLKERSWNSKANLEIWRRGWEESANEHLARAGLSARIDHRTLKAQQLDLIPGRKIGVSRERQQSSALPHRIAERVAEQKAIAAENGSQIIIEPKVAIKALTHYQSTFTKHDIAKFLHTRTDGAEQFRDAYLKVTTSPELVVLGKDDRGHERYTSREMLEAESEMLYRAELMTLRTGHSVAKHRVANAPLQDDLSGEQRTALNHLIEPGDLKSLVGVAGSGKSQLLSIAREAWEAEGYTVKGAALSGIAAENLTQASGIAARTLASYELAWQANRDPLTAKDILVIDEAGMIGTRQFARLLEAADQAKAKVVLIGDPEQLQAIEAGGAFRGIIAESGIAELNEVRRQTVTWQQNATRQLATGATPDALAAYDREGAITQTATRERARSALISRWSADAWSKPAETRLILAYTREDVRKLNEAARAVRRERGELGQSEVIETERGMREFAVHDRLYFLRNERTLHVKNATLGTITSVEKGVLEVRLDGTKEQVKVDTRYYRDLDHGYAATLYKAQGATVDRSYVLATPHFDRHATYVALSRHRHHASMFYATEDFGDPHARQQLVDVLSRARPKELAHDYLDRDDNYRYIETPNTNLDRDDHHRYIEAANTNLDSPNSPTPMTMADIDALQQRAAEKWLNKHLTGQYPPAAQSSLQHEKDLDPDPSRQRQREIENRGLERPGLGDDLEI